MPPELSGAPSTPPHFHYLRFDARQCLRELDDFARLLDSRTKELDEAKDILPFFKEHLHLLLSLGSFNVNVTRFDMWALEFSLSGMFRADAVIGDSHNHNYCFVEFESAKLTDVFIAQSNRTWSRWADRFERGFSQLVDWLWLLDSESGSQSFESRYGAREIKATALLVMGRDAGISDVDRPRYRWRREHIAAQAGLVLFYTYDELYEVMRQRVEFWLQAAGH